MSPSSVSVKDYFVGFGFSPKSNQTKQKDNFNPKPKNPMVRGNGSKLKKGQEEIKTKKFQRHDY